MFPFFGLLVIGVVAYVGIRAFHSTRTGPSEQTDSALETLRQQYARGEIDEEEFQSKKARLDG